MPEGHVLHRLADSLGGAFAGHEVGVSSPQGRFTESAALVDGALLEDASAWGKHLFLRFSGERYVHVHLGLYGKFAVHPRAAEVKPPVGQVRMRLVRLDLEPQDTMAYADLRGATACELLTGAEREAVLARQGPDPIVPGEDPTPAWDRIRRSRAPIGGLLMDQTVLAGVGNVYRAEVLFRHRMHHLRPGNTLRVGQWDAIWADLVELMTEGTRTGRIVTLRPEDRAKRAGATRPGRDRGKGVYVYRRTGEACLICGSTIRTEVLQARNVFWCPRCQPVFRSRAGG